MPTDIRGLDTILHGGLPTGRTTILSGGPGSGKTVLAMEFLYRGALAGRAGAFLSLEERAGDLRANAAAMGFDLADVEGQGLLRVASASPPYGAIPSGEFDIKGLLAILDGYVKAVGARCVVLDALDALIRLFNDPERERQQWHVLCDWLRERSLTAVLTVKGGTDGRRLYPFLDFMADCVIHMDQRIAEQVRTRRLVVQKYRGSGFLANEHPYVITSTGTVFMPVSALELAGTPIGEFVSSGRDDLDEVLGGGYRTGSCVMIAGPSGVGKTTLACLFALAACRRNEKTLMVHFEECQPSVVAGMYRAGLDLRRPLEDGTLTMTTAIPESRGAEEHLATILDAIDTFQPAHMVVDAISACRRMGSSHAAFDFLVRLLTVCKGRGITCLYTNQTEVRNHGLDVAGAGISSLVDTAVSLRYHDDGMRIRRRLLVVKSRGVSHSRRHHELVIDDNGVRLSDCREPAEGPTPSREATI